MAKKDTNENVLGMLAHLLGIFTGFVGPLVLFLVTKDKKGGLANENAKHALNFQISMMIYYIISFILVFVLVGILLLSVFWLFIFLYNEIK